MLEGIRFSQNKKLLASEVAAEDFLIGTRVSTNKDVIIEFSELLKLFGSGGISIFGTYADMMEVIPAQAGLLAFVTFDELLYISVEETEISWIPVRVSHSDVFKHGYSQGLQANRPITGIQGLVYFSTDKKILNIAYDAGASYAWVELHFPSVSSYRTVITTPATLDPVLDKFIGIDATAGAMTFNLGAVADSVGKEFHIRKTDDSASIVTIQPAEDELINGVVNVIVRLTAQNDSVSITSDGSGWIIFGSINAVVIIFVSAPVAVSATEITDISFSANWGAIIGATGYKLDVATDSEFTELVSGYDDLDVENVLTYSVTSLDSGKNYYYRVRAYNEFGVSDNSNVIAVNMPYMRFYAGTSNNISELRIGLAVNDTIYCAGGITICDTVNGEFVTSLAKSSGNTSTFIKRTDNTIDGYIFLSYGNVIRYGTGFGAANQGLRYVVGSAAGTPNHFMYMDRMSSAATVICIVGGTSTVLTTIKGSLPAGLTSIFASTGSKGTINGALPVNCVNIYLATITWTHSGNLPAAFAQLMLYAPTAWTGLNLSSTANIVALTLSSFFGSTMTPAQFSTLLQSLDTNPANKLPAGGVIGNMPDLRDTNQGGIWGTFTGVPANDTPSALAIALKSVVKTKVMALTLNTWQCVIPTESGDGTGFPQYFGDWWRA